MANPIYDLIKSNLNEDVMNQLSIQLGNPDREQVAAAAEGTVNTIVTALAKNTQTPEGAIALSNAIERDHDGSLLDNLLGVLTGQAQTSNRSFDGLGILMHLLGNKTTDAVDMLTNLSGMDRNKSSRLMIMLAPAVLAALGKLKRNNNLDPGGLQNLINNTVETEKQNTQNPSINLITQFLDQNNDGKIRDEITNIGLKMLGNLFRRR